MAKNKVEITTMDRKKFIVEVDNFDALAINEQMNAEDTRTVIIGDAILDRNNIMRVIPVAASEEPKK